jgi:glycosyltransferase involved in cell wall biosynthesis
MKKLFIGPSLLSGIGQVTKTLSDLARGEYVCFGDVPKGDRYSIGFCFVIPTDVSIEFAKQYARICQRMHYMTVCETETVHESYKRLFELSDTFLVPSEFASKVLSRQFPEGTFPVLRHYAPPPLPCPTMTEDTQVLETIPNDAYVFYHIGNIIDPRKNISMLINTFIRLNLPNSYLVLKASCNRYIPWSFPNGIIIQGERSKSELEYIHSKCHCYVSCSFSEGAGMGAIEAAVRNKPVIVQEYGAALEYIDTPYVIRCTGLRTVGADDFLFTKDMQWGEHEWSDLETHMRHAYTNRVMFQEHPKTHAIMEEINQCFLVE